MDLIVVSGLAFEANIAQGPGNQTVFGLDRSKLIGDIEAAVSRGAIGIISFGTAGGLAAHAHPGDLVVAESVCAAGGLWRTHLAWSQAIADKLPHALRGSVYGAANPIASALEKADVAAKTGALAVDMESDVAAEIAARANLPLAVLRVILDPASRTLPPAALAAARPDGSTNLAAVLASLMKKPGQLPALIRLAGDNNAARASLLRCRQTLGARFGFPNGGHLPLDMK